MNKRLLEVADAVCPSFKITFENISLLPSTVADRVSEISADSESGLNKMYRGFDVFPVAVDQGTDITDNAECAIFIRGVDGSFNVTEELEQPLVPAFSECFLKEWSSGQDHPRN